MDYVVRRHGPWLSGLFWIHKFDQIRRLQLNLLRLEYR